jgi:hypothetical protein
MTHEKDALRHRWITILRQKAKYEHDDRKAGKVVTSPDIDDICNEINAFFVGLEDK